MLNSKYAETLTLTLSVGCDKASTKSMTLDVPGGLIFDNEINVNVDDGGFFMLVRWRHPGKKPGYEFKLRSFSETDKAALTAAIHLSQ